MHLLEVCTSADDLLSTTLHYVCSDLVIGPYTCTAFYRLSASILRQPQASSMYDSTPSPKGRSARCVRVRVRGGGGGGLRW